MNPPPSTPTVKRSLGVLPARIEAHLLGKLDGLFVPTKGRLDAKSLHRLRVAARRLRVSLRYFAPLFPENELEPVRRELRQLTRALGELRTMDVNIHLLRNAARRLPVTATTVCCKLANKWFATRRTQSKTIQDLAHDLRTGHCQARIRALILRLRTFDEKWLLKESAATLNQLRRELSRRHRKYRRQQSREAFHQLRLAAKRYRYALETTAAVFGAAATPRIRAVKTLQDRTGACHDLEVLIDCLKAARTSDKGLAGALSEVITFFRTEHAAQFERFEEFLQADRSWTKKVKLTLPYE